MKIASWNVNSVKARRERLLSWLDRHKPDVLCLQELKTQDDTFPTADVFELGYHAVLHGQRTYNGVAILSREPPTDVRRNIDDDAPDTEARLISASVNGIRVISCYVPNGQEVGSDKWAYKLSWLDRLLAYLARHHSPGEPLVLCGDFNIAPEDRDVCNTFEWNGTVLCHPDVRERWARLREFGLVDTFRIHEQAAGKYSWWDYRMLAFPKGQGLRIDFVLATPSLAERCISASIDRDERKGKLPSDHAPVIAEFNWP